MRQKHYIIPLKPLAWARTGANHAQRRFFDKQLKEKLCFSVYFQSQHEDEAFFEIPSVDIIFYFRRSQKTKPSGYPWHIYKPDGDNCSKFLFDVMKGIVYHDDCQIAMSSFQKKWSDEDRILITVTELKEEKKK